MIARRKTHLAWIIQRFPPSLKVPCLTKLFAHWDKKKSDFASSLELDASQLCKTQQSRQVHASQWVLDAQLRSVNPDVPTWGVRIQGVSAMSRNQCLQQSNLKEIQSWPWILHYFFNSGFENEAFLSSLTQYSPVCSRPCRACSPRVIGSKREGLCLLERTSNNSYLPCGACIGAIASLCCFSDVSEALVSDRRYWKP